ncbi:MAG: hypothetical protein JXN62_11070 [Bacteroidales bacterium]|nr:hypothetical protein [Bacteroidales bacterium]
MRNFVLLIVFISFSVTSCKKDEDFVKSLPSCPDGIVFPVSPIAPEHVIRIVPLGHYNPSSHVFPTSHHYIDIVRGIGSIPIYAPCDGWITFVTENQLPEPYNVEYSVTLWACRDIMVKYGHVPRLDESILDQLGEITKTDIYSTGGKTFNLNIYEPIIRVKAGDRIGELPDMPEITGIDYGTIDKRKILSLIKPERWGEYGYINAVSFLNYTTSAIRDFYFEVVQNGNEGYLQRKVPPFEGEVCYDVEGTIRGLWFMPGKPLIPEDPHLSLILNNFDPVKNVISMGTSVPGIPSLAYEFYPLETGTHNRPFDQITNDGNIYTFSDFVNIWDQPLTDFLFPSENVILMQLIDNETLRIEQQTVSDGPPWSFRNNFRDFKR